MSLSSMTSQQSSEVRLHVVPVELVISLGLDKHTWFSAIITK